MWGVGYVVIWVVVMEVFVFVGDWVFFVYEFEYVIFGSDDFWFDEVFECWVCGREICDEIVVFFILWGCVGYCIDGDDVGYVVWYVDGYWVWVVIFSGGDDDDVSLLSCYDCLV